MPVTDKGGREGRRKGGRKEGGREGGRGVGRREGVRAGEGVRTEASRQYSSFNSTIDIVHVRQRNIRK